MKAALILLPALALMSACEPLSQAERNELRAREAARVVQARIKKAEREAAAAKKERARTAPRPACQCDCPQRSDSGDHTVTVASIPSGVPMGGGLHMSVR